MMSERVREHIKSALIVLLSLSAAFLMWRVWDDASPHSAAPAGGAGKSLLETAYTGSSFPVALSVKSQGRRVGITFDRAAAEAVLARLGEGIGEGLGSSARPEDADENEWTDALKGDGLYMLFPEPVPVSSVARWFSSEAPEHIARAFVKKLILRIDGEEVTLYYEDGDGRRKRAATSAHATAFENAFGSISADECILGCESGDPYLRALPEFLIFEHKDPPPLIADTGFADSEERRAALVRRFSMNPYGDNRYQDASGAYVYVYEGRSLRVQPDGRVTYRDSRENSPGGLNIASTGSPTTDDIIDGARVLASQAASLYSRGAGVYLTGCAEENGETVISFGYEVNGLPVTGIPELLRMWVKDGVVTRAEMNITSFGEQEELSYLYPPRQAAAMAAAEGKNNLSFAYLPAEDGLFAARYVY